MTTQPRMSAPIGRLRITTAEARRRGNSGSGRWRAADPPTESEVTEVEDTQAESTHPPFYPFPLRATHDDDG